jgi:hypothetical protein
MVIYMEQTLGLMYHLAMEKGEEAVMEVQQLIDSGTIKENEKGYKYLVINDNENLNDTQDETI